MDRKKSKALFEISSDLRIRRSLRDFFLSLRQIVRIRLSAKYGMLGLTSLAFSWLSLFALDRLGETPATVRGLVLILGVSGALWTGSKLYSIIFRLSRDSGWLARQVRKRYRGKGERMLGIIEIAGEREAEEPGFSPRIFEAAQVRMEKELQSMNLVLLIGIQFPGLHTDGFCASQDLETWQEKWTFMIPTRKRI